MVEDIENKHFNQVSKTKYTVFGAEKEIND